LNQFFRKKIKKIILLSFFIPLSSCYLLTPVDKEKYSDLEGHVYSQDSKIPLINAKVNILEISTNENTDKNGLFSLEGLPVGWLTVEVSVPGYEKLLRKIKIEPMGAKYVDFWLKNSNDNQFKCENFIFERSGDIWLSDEFGIKQNNLTEKSNPNSLLPDLTAGFSYHNPVWYKNKEKIAYVVKDNSIRPNTMNGLWIMNQSGKMNQRVTYVESQVNGLNVTESGNDFVFSMINPDNASNINLYRYDRQKNKVENLSGYLSREISPRYSPDGKMIAYTGNFTERALGNNYDPSQFTNSRSQIFVMNSGGSGKKQLTNSGENFDPAWSPDGQKIAFISNRNGSLELWLMNRDGSSQRSLTNTKATRAANPSWSDDGRRIIFNTNFRQKYESMQAKEAWIFDFNDFSLRMVSNDAFTPDW